METSGWVFESRAPYCGSALWQLLDPIRQNAVVTETSRSLTCATLGTRTGAQPSKSKPIAARRRRLRRRLPLGPGRPARATPAPSRSTAALVLAATTPAGADDDSLALRPDTGENPTLGVGKVLKLGRLAVKLQLVLQCLPRSPFSIDGGRARARPLHQERS